MLFLGIFRSDLQKIVKKGSKFGPPGEKTENNRDELSRKFFKLNIT